MRHKWLLWIATAPILLVLTCPKTASAKACTGVEAAATARLSNSAIHKLGALAAQTRQQRRRDIDSLEDKRSARGIEDPSRGYLDGRTGLIGTTVDSRSHLGLTACQPSTRANARLAATWWGTYYRLEDPSVRPDYENHTLPYKGGRSFYVRSRHRLRADSETLAWSSSIVGVGWDFAANASITVAGLHEQSPRASDWSAWASSNQVDTTHVDGWGIYTSVTIPFVGTRFSIASRPHFSGLTLAELEADSVPLGDTLRGGFKVGMTRENGPFLSAIGVYDIPGGFSVELGGYPALLAPAFAQIEWSYPLEYVEYSPPKDGARWSESLAALQILPFAGISANYAPEELDPDDAGWFPGFSAGTEARIHMLNGADSESPVGFGVGLRVEGGVNRPADLQSVPSLRGQGYWGTNLNLYLWFG
jgi:hypothetical protein